MKNSGSKKKWTVVYLSSAQDDILLFGTIQKERIKTVIREKIEIHPFLHGIPLRGNLRNLYKIRVGNVRIVFEICADTVCILGIRFRKDVYSVIKRRI